MIDFDMPCGNCYCGVYDQSAIDAFNGTVPKCKIYDRLCVGAVHRAIYEIGMLREKIRVMEVGE